jgi:5-(hydroxymethyl)furfural/furfural oxidase
MYIEDTFDVIIAGGGTAGCVLASRLSEDFNRRVLLLEAGPDVAAPGAEHPDIVDPLCLCASSNPAFHWPHLTAAMTDAGEGNPRPPEVPYLQGYGVGGASNINGMGVDRGQPEDYEEWCALGAAGWGWKEVLPYFKKIETDLDFSGNDPLSAHGARGPVPVRRISKSYWAPFASAIGDAI